MLQRRKTEAADLRDQAGGPAKRRVNVTEPRDLHALAVELGCTRGELKVAVEKVGNIVSDLASFLKGETVKSTHVENAQATAALNSLFER